jgi:outer membrane biogenesis lipoprotein LolB
VKEAVVMNRRLVLVLAALALLSGCSGTTYSGYSDPSASPDLWRQAECERDGGYWNPNAHVCEGRLYRW